MDRIHIISTVSGAALLLAGIVSFLMPLATPLRMALLIAGAIGIAYGVWGPAV